GIGQLSRIRPGDAQAKPLDNIADRALIYMDKQLMDDARQAGKGKDPYGRGISAIRIHAWYARSYFADRKMPEALRSIFSTYLKQADEQWIYANTGEQAMIALTFLRAKQPKTAGRIIRSLLETAKQSPETGMYWPKNVAGYSWNESPVETQSLLIELFTETGTDPKIIDELKIWLLRNKQTSNWATTKATAAACYALLIKNTDWLSPDNSSGIRIAGQPLGTLKPEVKTAAGNGYLKTGWADEQVKPELAMLSIHNSGKSISWGAMHWQYLEEPDKISPSKTDLNLQRDYYVVRQTGSGPASVAVDTKNQPKTGDILKVIIRIRSGRDLEYVHLKDLRPAGTEPMNAISAFKYQDGLACYEVTKDVATNFFISTLKKGSYVFEYTLRVVQPGNFSAGISTIQSMYAPEFNAHSEGRRLLFQP
ncbi:MAG: alpha-2-macroglobulin, partial [Mucilaginibacter polytrichastri]|nr:alpha-2-macroglobulin [Mucilaginibacter polytrichastri]